MFLYLGIAIVLSIANVYRCRINIKNLEEEIALLDARHKQEIAQLQAQLEIARAGRR